MCRSRRELSNDYLAGKIGFDTAENDPCNVCPLAVYRSSRLHELFTGLCIRGEFDLARNPNPEYKRIRSSPFLGTLRLLVQFVQFLVQFILQFLVQFLLQYLLRLSMPFRVPRLVPVRFEVYIFCDEK